MVLPGRHRGRGGGAAADAEDRARDARAARRAQRRPRSSAPRRRPARRRIAAGDLLRQGPRVLRGAGAAAHLGLRGGALGHEGRDRRGAAPATERSPMAEVELPKPEELHEQAENRFSRRVALVTAVFAVVLAIAALGGNHAMKEMLLVPAEVLRPVGVLPGQGHPRAPLPRAEAQARGRPRRARRHPQARGPGEARGAARRSSRRRRSATTSRRRTSRRRRRRSSTQRDGFAAKRSVLPRRGGAAPDRHRDGVGLDPGPLRLDLLVQPGAGRVGAVLTLNGLLPVFQLPFMHGGGALSLSRLPSGERAGLRALQRRGAEG